MNGATLVVLQQLGYSARNEPILGGALIFLIAGLSISYLAFVRKEMNAGPVLKAGGVLLLALAVLAYYWPQRPWPH
jgi:hypothetical protein